MTVGLSINELNLSPAQRQAAIAALGTRDFTTLASLCRALIENCDFRGSASLAMAGLSDGPYSPALGLLAGLSFARLGQLDLAYFHLFNSYAENQNEEALREIREIEKLFPGTSTSVSTGKVPTTPGDGELPLLTTFVVSNLESTFPSILDNLMVADPFVHHQLTRDRRLNGATRVQVAPYVAQDPKHKAELVSKVLEKQRKYLPILVPRLNDLHGTSLSHEFWKRSLGLSFERSIALVFEFYEMCEAHFDTGKYTCTPLSQESFYSPLDFDEQRFLLEHWAFGREQLFSCYLAEFYPEKYRSVHDRFSSSYQVREISSVTPFQPIVGIMGAFFAPHFHRRLIEESNGRINEIGFQRRFEIREHRIDVQARQALFAPFATMDRFDRFFFRSLIALMPRVFVELFADMIGSMASQLGIYSKLKYIVSEMWIGEAYEPIALALLHEMRGVQTIYNEHNINVHQYIASLMPRWADYCDIYVAHGNYGHEIPNILQLGSLYDFGYGLADTTKSVSVTYMSGLSFARDSDFCGNAPVLGVAENAPRRFDFKRRFFAALDSPTRASMVYRGYPRDEYLKHWSATFDDELLMGSLLNGIERDDFKQPGRLRMAQSELVVIDYLGTSYLEAFFMNIPTIILVYGDLATYNEKYHNFLTPLIEVGICQTDPEEAARFIGSIRQDPGSWWRTEKVQLVRDTFLRENLGDSGAFLNFLLGNCAE